MEDIIIKAKKKKKKGGGMETKERMKKVAFEWGFDNCLPKGLKKL